MVYGLVRDTSGWPVDEPSAQVVFSSGGREIGRASINSDRSFEENYRALLPVDMDPESGSYKPGVVEANLPFTVHVESGGQRLIPIESFVGIDAPAEPGTVVNLDLTLGVDSDGDSLPDEWEFWQLEAGGVAPGEPGHSLDRLSRNGDYDNDGLSDYDEYLAGTYAYLGADRLELHVIGIGDDGWLELEFLAIIDKAYRFEASSDLGTWVTVEVGIGRDRNALVSAFRATNTQLIRISIPPDPESSARLYRAGVR